MSQDGYKYTKGKMRQLALINKISLIFKKKLPIETTLQQIAFILPEGMKYNDACARILYQDKRYASQNFNISPWRLVQSFRPLINPPGFVEIYYLNHHPDQFSGPFSQNEDELLKQVVAMISQFIEEKRNISPQIKNAKFESSAPSGSNYLHQFLNHTYSNRDIFHDLMPFKVEEILLISTLYDAFSIESEGRIFDQVLGDYQQLNLTSIPRITGVTKINDAFKALREKHFDLVIVMVGSDSKKPVFIGREVKKLFPYLPVFLLLNNNKDIHSLEKLHLEGFTYDRLFAWNGDSKIFFAMIKLVEDRINLDNDTLKASVRVILLVEDSPKFYSRFLTTLYNVVMDQTRRIIRDVQTDELYKVLRIRARPKIILASTYEQAIDIIENYRDYMLAVITDTRFDKDGKKQSDAGFQLANHIRNNGLDIPLILHSAEDRNEKIAQEMNLQFINKNSPNLSILFRNFITNYLGFGDFVFRLPDHTEVGLAKTMREFVDFLKVIPDESLRYHANNNHFSHWLMARGEIEIAKIIRPVRENDFTDIVQVRNYILNTIEEYRQERMRGKIISFDEHRWSDHKNIVMIADGALGGKGRGLAFINMLIYNIGLGKGLEKITITTPQTFVIGTDEYDYFMQSNGLYNKIQQIDEIEKIRLVFHQAKLSQQTENRLLELVKNVRKPLAVRSSGLFEDSLSQSFSGVFETYMLPNNHPELKVRWKQLIQAVKMVYASVFSNEAKSYIESVNYKIDEEKMAVVIQEVVGRNYDDNFYPHISGVAQSYNYYPFSYMKPEDGFAILAMGLGVYTVEGEKSFKFCPKYPQLQHNSVNDQITNSQRHFYALDMQNTQPLLEQGENAALKRLRITQAESHGTLKHIASTYNAYNDSIKPGISLKGSRIINFANILQYNYIPLSETITRVLDLVQDVTDTPVEIEFAVLLSESKQAQAEFHLLQIKPLLSKGVDFEITREDLESENLILLSEKGLGNGYHNEIQDIVFVRPETFDKTRTREMAEEIAEINKRMVIEKRKYVLIGPGRWGTRDEFIGIPVKWTDISNAAVIVETDLEGFPLEASAGSHFFNNVISMNVGYYSIFHGKEKNFIHYEYLNSCSQKQLGKFFTHVKLEKPFAIKMDGKKGIGLILRGD